MIGKIGRVTGKVGPGLVGEVMLPVRGGTETFYAYPFNDEVIEIGARVSVADFDAPRAVYVSRIGAPDTTKHPAGSGSAVRGSHLSVVPTEQTAARSHSHAAHRDQGEQVMPAAA